MKLTELRKVGLDKWEEEDFDFLVNLFSNKEQYLYKIIRSLSNIDECDNIQVHSKRMNINSINKKKFLTRLSVQEQLEELNKISDLKKDIGSSIVNNIFPLSSQKNRKKYNMKSQHELINSKDINDININSLKNRYSQIHSSSTERMKEFYIKKKALESQLYKLIENKQ